MKYEGPLYGKIGRRYLKLKQTSEDVDAMEEKLRLAEAEKELFRGMLIQLHFNDKIQEFISQSKPLP